MITGCQADCSMCEHEMNSVCVSACGRSTHLQAPDTWCTSSSARSQQSTGACEWEHWVGQLNRGCLWEFILCTQWLSAFLFARLWPSAPSVCTLLLLIFFFHQNPWHSDLALLCSPASSSSFSSSSLSWLHGNYKGCPEVRDPFQRRVAFPERRRMGRRRICLKRTRLSFCFTGGREGGESHQSVGRGSFWSSLLKKTQRAEDGGERRSCVKDVSVRNSAQCAECGILWAFWYTLFSQFRCWNFMTGSLKQHGK